MSLLTLLAPRTMTLALSNTAEGAPLSTELVIGDTGGASGDAFTAITKAGTGSLTAVAATVQGAQAYRVHGPTSTDTVSVDWTISTGGQTASWRIYLSITAIVGTAALIDTRATSLMGRVSVSATGQLIINDSLNAAAYTSAAGVIPLDGSWFMVDFALDGGTTTTDGKARVRVWRGAPLAVTHDVEIVGQNLFRAGGITRRRFGKLASSGTITFLADTPAVTDTYTLIGPYVAPVVPPVIPAGPFAVILLTGASNMRGYATDYDAAGVDAYPAGVYELTPTSATTGSIVPAVEPVLSLDVNTGMGPCNTYIKDLITGGETRPILIVNAARGGTGFITPDSNAGALSWRTDLPDTSDNLFEVSLDLLATATALTTNGGTVVAILHNAGTTDSTANMAPATWTPYMRALVDGYRARISATVPFLMMQSRPSLMGENRHLIIDQAAQAIPAVEPYTAYAFSPVGAIYEKADSTHFNAAGVRVIGHNLYAVLPDAQANVPTTTGTLAASPPPVTSTLAGTSTNTGTLAAVTLPPTATLTGAQTNPGALTGTVPPATAALAGASTNPGSLAAATPNPTSSTSGTQRNPGTMAAASPLVRGSLADTTTITGSLAASTPLTAASVTGTQRNVGTFAATTPKVTATLTGTSINAGTLAAVAPKVSASLPGAGAITGTLTAALPLPITQVTGTSVNHGTLLASPRAPTATITGTTADRHDVTVTVTLERRRWTGTLAPRNKTATVAARRWTGALAPNVTTATLAARRWTGDLP